MWLEIFFFTPHPSYFIPHTSFLLLLFMRILYILNRIPLPLTDGGAICSYNSVKFLHAAGHELHVLALNTKKHYQDPAQMLDVCTSIDTIDIVTDVRALDAARNLVFSRRPYIAERFHKEIFANLICATLQDEKFDVVHIDHTMIAWYVDAIRARVPKPPPIVLRTHNIEHVIQERLAAHERNPAKSWYRRFLARRMKAYETAYFPKFDALMAITPEEQAMMRQMGYSGTTALIPAGVDIAKFSPNPSIQARAGTMCYIGGMDWQPNIEAVQWFVSEVLPLVHRTHPSAEMHIAGKRMPAEVRAFGEAHGAFMHPDVPSAADFIQSHAMLLVPLLSGGGMRLKIVEAMSLGVPIISTRIGAEGVAVRHGESILLADTAEEFAHAISELLHSPNLAQALARNARDIALREYSWENIAQKMSMLYEQVQKAAGAAEG